MSVVVSVIAGFFLLFAITWSIQDYEAERTTALGPAAGADLHRRGRRQPRHLPAVHLRGRAVLLRHGVGDRQLADGVRLRPRRRAARLAAVEARSTRAPVRRPTRSGCASCCSHAAGAAVAVEHHRLPGGHLDRGHRPLHRVRRRRCCCAGCGPTSRPGRGTSASGARRSAGSPSSGSASSACCSCCRRRARSRRPTSTTRSSRWRWCSAARGCGGCSAPASGSPGRGRTSRRRRTGVGRGRAGG